MAILGLGFNNDRMTPFIETTEGRQWHSTHKGWDRDGFFLDQSGESVRFEFRDVDPSHFTAELAVIEAEAKAEAEAFNERLSKAHYKLWKMSPSWQAGWFDIDERVTLDEAMPHLVEWNYHLGWNDTTEPERPFKDVNLEIKIARTNFLAGKSTKFLVNGDEWLKEQGIEISEPITALLFEFDD